MSIVVSAPIRSGKTLYCMQIIDKVSKKEPYRRIYTNIIGCNYPGVISIQSTLEKPFDWRDLPNGAILIYDECHEHPAFSKEDLLKTFEIDDSEYLKRVSEINSDLELKVKEKEELVRQEKKKQELRLLRAKEDILDIGRSLTMHGHFGIEIYFITQKPYLLNSAVRASCNEHLILRRLFKLKAATIYQYAELQEQFGFSTMKNALSWRFWFYPKQLFKFYISAEEHEKSTKLPASFKIVPLIILIIIFYAIKDTLNSPLLQRYLPDWLKSKTVAEQSTAQYAQSKDSSAQKTEDDKKETLDCNDLNNSHIEQCIKYNTEKQNRLNAEIRNSQYIAYDPNNPFTEQSNQMYTATAQPVFSGCIKFDGKYYGYTQQGTKLNVSESDCKKLIENGDRPFNYFAQQQHQAQAINVQ